MARNPLLLLLLLIASCTLVAALDRRVSPVPNVLGDRINVELLFSLKHMGLLTSGAALLRAANNDPNTLLRSFGIGPVVNTIRSHLAHIPANDADLDTPTDQQYYAALLATTVIDMSHIVRYYPEIVNALRDVICEETMYGNRVVFVERVLSRFSILALIDFYFMRVYGARLRDGGTQGLREMVLGLMGYAKFTCFWDKSRADLYGQYIRNAIPLNLLPLPVLSRPAPNIAPDRIWSHFFSTLRINDLATILLRLMGQAPFRDRMYRDWQVARNPGSPGDVTLAGCAEMLYLLGFSQHPLPFSLTYTVGRAVRKLVDARLLVPVGVIFFAWAAWVLWRSYPAAATISTSPVTSFELPLKESVLFSDAAVENNPTSIEEFLQMQNRTGNPDGLSQEELEWATFWMIVFVLVFIVLLINYGDLLDKVMWVPAF